VGGEGAPSKAERILISEVNIRGVQVSIHLAR
jgi:hypothetical protein